MAGGVGVKPSHRPAAPVREGDVVAGKYRVDRVLGEGGMGIVVAAHHLQLDTRVAIKVLRPELLTNSDAVGRFTREARAAVRISSERVARVLDVGSLESGAPYMVMEFLEGADLSSTVARRGPLPIDEAIEYVLQACEAIAEAHCLGIVHRDLKPANLFCIRRSDGTTSIKVLDFGISKLTAVDPTTPELGMTKTTMMMGSPFYMSPEQMQSSKDVDARTDLWALGVILYEAVTGHVPFQGQTLPEVCVKIATQQPPPLLNYRPDAPVALEAVVLRCLEKDRDRRYANVAELAVALNDLATPRGRLSVDTILRTVQASGLPSMNLRVGAVTGTGDLGTVVPFGRSAPGLPRRRTAAIAGGIAAVLAIGAIALLLSLRGPSGAHPVAPAASAPPLPGVTASFSATVVNIPPPPPAETIAPLPSETAAPRASAPPPQPRKPPPPPAASSAPAPSAKAKPDCDPNFFLDAQGEKHFKPECFR